MDFMKLNIQLFAETTISASMSGDSSYTQRLTVEEIDTDVQNNTSTVKYTLTLSTTKSYTYGSYNLNGNDTYSVSINGSVVASGGYTYDFRKYHSLTIASGTVTITHDSDGTKTINLSSYVGMTHVSKGSGTATGSLTLTPLHRPPANIAYTITENNSVLTNASVANNVFVENLSIKKINVSGTLYDNATISRVGVYNGITPYSNTANPITLDLRSMTLGKNAAGTKIPLVAYIKDSFNTQGLSSSLDSPDLYDFIAYKKVSLIETSVFAKRYGQLTGQVKLNISGTYFNGTVGNKNQGSSYKPTIKYKFWELGTSEPSSFSNTIPAANISVSNGTFTVSNYSIGSTDSSASNYFDPSKIYKVKVYVSDNFTNYTSSEKTISKGKAVWTEYKDRVDFEKITIQNQYEVLGWEVVDTW